MQLNKIISIVVVVVLMSGCADFLNETPKGVLSSDQENDPERLLTAAYSALGNDHYDVPLSLWPYGTVRSDDAYKGGSGPQDIQVFHFFEVSNNIMPNFAKWIAYGFNAISPFHVPITLFAPYRKPKTLITKRRNWVKHVSCADTFTFC